MTHISPSKNPWPLPPSTFRLHPPWLSTAQLWDICRTATLRGARKISTWRTPQSEEGLPPLDCWLVFKWWFNDGSMISECFSNGTLWQWSIVKSMCASFSNCLMMLHCDWLIIGKSLMVTGLMTVDWVGGDHSHNVDLHRIVSGMLMYLPSRWLIRNPRLQPIQRC